jgi:hypothetical protein
VQPERICGFAWLLCGTHGPRTGGRDFEALARALRIPPEPGDVVAEEADVQPGLVVKQPTHIDAEASGIWRCGRVVHPEINRVEAGHKTAGDREWRVSTEAGTREARAGAVHDDVEPGVVHDHWPRSCTWDTS